MAERCANDGLCAMGLRFSEDKTAPGERFATLKQRLGDAFEVIEIDSSPGNAGGFGKMAHSVLTDEVREVDGQPAYEARKRVVEFLTRGSLKGSSPRQARARMAIDNLVVETTHGPVRGGEARPRPGIRAWKGIRVRRAARRRPAFPGARAARAVDRGRRRHRASGRPARNRSSPTCRSTWARRRARTA